MALTDVEMNSALWCPFISAALVHVPNFRHMRFSPGDFLMFYQINVFPWCIFKCFFFLGWGEGGRCIG